jgi:hypothetical protein
MKEGKYLSYSWETQMIENSEYEQYKPIRHGNIWKKKE